MARSIDMKDIHVKGTIQINPSFIAQNLVIENADVSGDINVAGS